MKYAETWTLFDILKYNLLPRLEDPCNHCAMYECKKHGLKFTMRKRYAKMNWLDYRYCLKRKRRQLHILLNALRKPPFDKLSAEKCEKCGVRMFWRDLHVHIECEKRDPKNPKDYYEIKPFRLCPKCSRAYKRSKKPLYAGFERR